MNAAQENSMHCVYCNGWGVIGIHSDARDCMTCGSTGLDIRNAGDFLSFISRVDTALGDDSHLLDDYRRNEKIEWYLSNYTPAEIARLMESAADGDPRHYPPASIL